MNKKSKFLPIMFQQHFTQPRRFPNLLIINPLKHPPPLFQILVRFLQHLDIHIGKIETVVEHTEHCGNHIFVRVHGTVLIAALQDERFFQEIVPVDADYLPFVAGCQDGVAVDVGAAVAVCVQGFGGGFQLFLESLFHVQAEVHIVQSHSNPGTRIKLPLLKKHRDHIESISRKHPINLPMIRTCIRPPQVHIFPHHNIIIGSIFFHYGMIVGEQMFDKLAVLGITHCVGALEVAEIAEERFGEGDFLVAGGPENLAVVLAHQTDGDVQGAQVAELGVGFLEQFADCFHHYYNNNDNNLIFKDEMVILG